MSDFDKMAQEFHFGSTVSMLEQSLQDILLAQFSVEKGFLAV